MMYKKSMLKADTLTYDSATIDDYMGKTASSFIKLPFSQKGLVTTLSSNTLKKIQ